MAWSTTDGGCFTYSREPWGRPGEVRPQRSQYNRGTDLDDLASCCPIKSSNQDSCRLVPNPDLASSHHQAPQTALLDVALGPSSCSPSYTRSDTSLFLCLRFGSLRAWFSCQTPIWDSVIAVLQEKAMYVKYLTGIHLYIHNKPAWKVV